MTTAALARHLAEAPPHPPAPVPSGRQPDYQTGIVATVTVQVLLRDEIRDPATAVRAVMEYLATAGTVTIPPLRLVTATAPEYEVRPAVTDPDSHHITVDVAARSVSSDGVQVELCRREFELLLFLAEHPRQVFTRRQLLTAVWTDSYTGERTIDVHVNRLRNKLGRQEDLITTVRGVGYRLADHAPLIVNSPLRP